jgi:predicted Zn-dependent protease
VTLQRAALIAVAVVAIAWLALSYEEARTIRDAQIVSADRHATPGRLTAALSDLRSSRILDPNRTEELSYEAVIELRLNHLGAGRRLLEEVVRREPDFAEPYLLLAELTRTSDPARSSRARAQLKRLDPLGGLP